MGGAKASLSMMNMNTNTNRGGLGGQDTTQHNTRVLPGSGLERRYVWYAYLIRPGLIRLYYSGFMYRYVGERKG